MQFIVFDTEDTSKELAEKHLAGLKKSGRTIHQSNNRWGFKKRVTQIAAMSTSGRTFYNKGDVPQFLKWVKDEPAQFVYAHNLQYDLGNLFGDCLDELYVTLIGSRMIKAEWGGKVWRDSLNIFPQMSVAKLGEKMGLKKLKFDAAGKEYVFRDVEIVFRAISKLVELVSEYGLEQLPSTLGGLCVKLWKTMGGYNWFCDSEFVRNSFFGGRVEIFKGSAVHCSLTDINSLYPHCMRNVFPTEMKEQKDINCLGIVHCKIKVPESLYCPLPFRMQDNRVYYPCGVLEGVWTTVEIQNAINNGCKIVKIISVSGSKKGEYYYRDFMEHFYKKRKQTKVEYEDLFYKLLMNNLYGQLATKGEVTRTADNAHLDAYYPCFGSKALITAQIPIPQHSNYLHASMITSYGRLQIFDWSKQIGFDKLVYEDTDGIIFEGKPPFECSMELGKMKLVKKNKSARVFGKKCYLFDGEAKAKGVPKSLAREFLDKGVAQFPQPFKFREAASRFDHGNSKKLSVWRMVEKRRITGEVTKRKIADKYLPIYVDAAAEIH